MDVTITVREYGYGDKATGFPPRNLPAMIKALQETLLEVPPEYRDLTDVSFEPWWEHGESYEHIRITYERPETEAEAVARKAAERSSRIKWIDEQEALIRRRKAELEIA